MVMLMESVGRACERHWGYPFFMLYIIVYKINHPQTIDVTDTLTRFSFTLPNHFNQHPQPPLLHKTSAQNYEQ